MLGYDVLQYRWLILSLVGGTALVLLIVASYLTIWRPRGAVERETSKPITGLWSALRWLHGFVPWVLVLLVVGLIIFGGIYTAIRIGHPPNW